MKLTKEQKNKLSELRTAYDELKEEIENFVHEIGDDFRGQWDDKSETWQNSDRGQEADDMICTWESVTVEDNPLDEIVEEI